MEKIIKFGFQPVINTVIRGQNDENGKKLFQSKHVYGVIEKTNDNRTVITGKVVPQTSVSNLYDVTISVDKDRHVNSAACTCKAGRKGNCKHVCALIHYINSPETSSSKTSHSQQWGKPTQKQLLGYDKGRRMCKLFTPPVLTAETSKLKPIKLTVSNMPDSLKNTPLRRMLELEEKENIVVTPAGLKLHMIQTEAKKLLEEKAKKVVSDIFVLQSMNAIFSQEIIITQEMYTFYQEKICCDANAALNLSVLTIEQSSSSEWFSQRTLRITASNGYRLKGHRFDVEKVVSDMLYPKMTKNNAMMYGKKYEDVALKEYKKLVDPKFEIVKVGVIISLQQPWLSCSPDAILVYGSGVWQKRLKEIKCPYTCRNLPIWDHNLSQSNVPYLKADENGLYLSTTHSIYIQVQLQMYVTNIGFCDLYVYSPKGSVLLTIQRDDQLLAKLIPHLEQFYFTEYIQRLYAKYSTE